MSFDALREECCEANRALGASGLVDLTFGNVSVLDRERGVFAIKPSGVAYAALSPSDMVLLDLDGNPVEGSLRPSSDTPTHRYLFRAFPHIRAVAHTHSHHAVAFAQAGREIPMLGTTHADYFFGAVPVTRSMTTDEIQGDYEWETGRVIAERFADLSPEEIPAALVRNHGPFVWAESGAKAVETAMALEIVARLAAITLSLEPQSPDASSELAKKHFFRKHGSTAYYGQKSPVPVGASLRG